MVGYLNVYSWAVYLVVILMVMLSFFPGGEWVKSLYVNSFKAYIVASICLFSLIMYLFFVVFNAPHSLFCHLYTHNTLLIHWFVHWGNLWKNNHKNPQNK